MKPTFTLLITIFTFFQLSAQIQGTITNSKNKPIPSVSIYFENTYNGTTSNDQGLYELDIPSKGKHTLVFQYLGYETIKKKIDINNNLIKLDIHLKEENIQLNEVTINSKENPANRIIRNAIDNRKENLNKVKFYTSDFYSKGIFRIKNAPKKIFGQEVGDLGGGLDSTRSGVVYLSETVSKISFKQPNLFKEKIIASKVSGNSNGFSYNKASEVDFNFYKNTIDIDNKVISPIATYAFNYYKYKLIGSFYEGEHLINKIEVTPKRRTDNAFTGTIYIVEDDWAIYGLDLTVSGKQMGQPMIDKLNLKQNYSYSEETSFWPILSQQIYFKFGMLGINVDGQFTTAYSNYNFNPNFKEKEFNNEILSFVENSNKKDSVFWSSTRPVILTAEETSDYKIKDSIQIRKKSKKYLDSIDRKNNKFKISDILLGYSYRNSHKKSYLNFSSILLGTSFNTVQGWAPTLKGSYYISNKDKGSSLSISSKLNYGLSEKKLRAEGRISYLFNSISKPYLTISGGQKITQFNEQEPISSLLNSVSTLFFENNFAKFYDKTFATISFSNEIVNGIRVSGSLGYEKRNPLINNTDYVLRNDKKKIYSSNDPLNESNNAIPSFE
ncbi:MAG: carboxypeptidase-like regulatory domain-containing protein, partial [Lutibacter sp.]|nr:carboxypeptidase-like regulatory domain-containing protein [Lutibacter sp.]